MKMVIDMLLKLFITFFKIGLFTFGGGYAMIPLIQKEVVDNHQWMNNKDIIDVVAISESTPGPIAINMATFVGYKTKGFWGALCSTLGVVLPSFIIIFCLCFVLNLFENSVLVQNAFNGIRVGILCLILNALISMYKQAPKHFLAYLIMGFSFLGITFFNLNAINVIILSAIFSFSYCLYNGGNIE